MLCIFPVMEAVLETRFLAAEQNVLRRAVEVQGVLDGEEPEALMVGLRQMAQDAEQVRAFGDAQQRECRDYQEQRSAIERGMVKTREAMEGLETELCLAIERRKNRDEVNMLTTLIERIPSHTESMAAMESIRKEMEVLRHEQDRLEKLKEQRHRQFALLFHALDELEQTSEAFAAPVEPDTNHDMDHDVDM